MFAAGLEIGLVEWAFRDIQLACIWRLEFCRGHGHHSKLRQESKRWLVAGLRNEGGVAGVWRAFAKRKRDRRAGLRNEAGIGGGLRNEMVLGGDADGVCREEWVVW